MKLAEYDGAEGGLVWHRPAALGPSTVGVPGVLVAREAHLVAVEAGIADFVRAAAANGAAHLSGAEGLRDLAVVNAALRSIASGRVESVAHV